MFRKMRRADKAIGYDESMRILEKGEHGVLSTIGEDGYPYGVPVSYAMLNGNIYFHCASDGHKLDNLVYNPKVSFCVVGDTEIIPSKFSTNYESVIVFGKAYEVHGEEKTEALLSLLNKYSKDFLDSGKAYMERDRDITTVIKISIEHLTGKAGVE